MRLAIIGLPQSGRSTIFRALTGARGEQETGDFSRIESHISTIVVYDERVDFLTDLIKPKKTTYAKVEYFLPAEITTGGAKSESGQWAEIRTCDALVHVVRNFPSPGGGEPTPEKDYWKTEEDMILSDLSVVEKRIERLELDIKRGKKEGEEELELLRACKDLLEQEIPLRSHKELATHPTLRGFTFLSAKPQLVIINNDDEDETMPPWQRKPENAEMIIIRGRLEMDIANMSPEEAKEFIEAYNIKESALDRTISASYRLLNLISFFTAGEQEVRAWSIPAGTPAIEAAGAVHTDMKKGFIRAEVVSFEDLKKHGSFQAVKKAGVMRLEGKDYVVKDGDIIHFRFNV